MTSQVAAFKPLPWQVNVWRDKSLICLMDGPAGTGKSHVAAHKVDAYLRKYPNATGLMVRKTRESMTNSTLLFYERMVLAGDPHVRLKRDLKRFEYSNGSILAYGGMKDDNQREALRSIGLVGGLDFVWMEEAHLFTLADFEELLPRMRGRAAYNYYLEQGYSEEEAQRRAWLQILLTTNPDSEFHWIYKRLIQGGEAKRYVAQTADNTYNPPNYGSTLDRLTGVRKKRLRDGSWVSAEGAVYDDYRYETHVIEPFVIPPTWTRFRSIDFGYRNPFVCQWWALDEDRRMYLYREIYMSDFTVAQHADEIKRLEAGIDRGAWDEMTTAQKRAAWNAEGSEKHLIKYTVADHDAEDRATLREQGISTLAAKKEIKVGIEKTQERFAVQGDGRPRIFFLNDALVQVDEKLMDGKKPLSTVEEIAGYVYPQGQDGRPVKEVPIDLDNHGMDSMRYAVMSVDHATAVLKPGGKNPFFK